MIRAYCLDDKPFPVSAKAMRTLREIFAGRLHYANAAPRQFERLRIGGYLRVNEGVATVTDAGRALLNRATDLQMTTHE